MQNLSRTTILLFIFLALPLNFALAQNLLIVEVQIAGEKTSDDFIKIYNPTDSDIYLSNYQGSYIRLVKRTKTSAKDYTIKSWSRDPEAKIPAKGFYFWANKDYTALSGVEAITSQTIATNNGIALRLGPENTGIIIDALGWGDFNNLLFEGNPFPENPGPNQRLERKKAAGVYQDTNNNANDFYLSPLSESKTEASLPESSQLKSKIYPSGIIINEILPNAPIGIKDEEGEYIEIFNQNSFEVDLSDWKIEDTTGQTTSYIFPRGRKIGSFNFLVLYRPVTKITLNNDGDGLNLIQPDGKIGDSVSYEKAPGGQSYNRTATGWAWSATLTPGLANVISAQKTEKAEREIGFIEEAGKIDINTASEKELQKIIGIRETLAQRIIEGRPFYSLEELTKVRGIGPKALAEIKKQGLAWVDSTLEPPKIEKKELPERGLAAVSEPFKEKSLGRGIPKPLSLFLIALALAIFSGIIILILKRRIKTGYNKNV